MSIFLSILSITWFIFSFYLSHQNGNQTYQTSIGLTEFLYSILEQLHLVGESALYANWILIDLEDFHMILRHGAHTIIFLIMTFLFCITITQLKRFGHLQKHPISPWVGFYFCLFWSWADEATKIFIEGRHFSWFDVSLNLLGCILGVFIYWLFLKIKTSSKNRNTENTDTKRKT